MNNIDLVLQARIDEYAFGMMIQSYAYTKYPRVIGNGLQGGC